MSRPSISCRFVCESRYGYVCVHCVCVLCVYGREDRSVEARDQCRVSSSIAVYVISRDRISRHGAILVPGWSTSPGTLPVLGSQTSAAMTALKLGTGDPNQDLQVCMAKILNRLSHVSGPFFEHCVSLEATFESKTRHHSLYWLAAGLSLSPAVILCITMVRSYQTNF